MQTPQITLKRVEQELRRLPAKRLKQVFLFVQFLEHIEQQGAALDDADDEDLWQAVLAHQDHRAKHPDETAQVFDSSEAFLKASKSW